MAGYEFVEEKIFGKVLREDDTTALHLLTKLDEQHLQDLEDAANDLLGLIAASRRTSWPTPARKTEIGRQNGLA